MPRRSGSPKGSGEVLERDRGSKSPVSLQPPPRGANKIYTYDVVFSICEARKKIQSQTPLPLRSPKLYPALSPRRRRMLPQPLANDLLRERIAHIGTQTDLHKLYPSPSPYKSFAELFQKRPFPRLPPFPSFPQFPSYPRIPSTYRRLQCRPLTVYNFMKC